VTNIFVGNLSYQTTQDDLHAAFAAYGGVERVNIVTDRDTGQPRGFAFVEMSDSQAAQQAITHLNGAELNGRALNVNEARPKPAGGGVCAAQGATGAPRDNARIRIFCVQRTAAAGPAAGGGVDEMARRLVEAPFSRDIENSQMAAISPLLRAPCRLPWSGDVAGTARDGTARRVGANGVIAANVIERPTGDHRRRA